MAWQPYHRSPSALVRIGFSIRSTYRCLLESNHQQAAAKMVDPCPHRLPSFLRGEAERTGEFARVVIDSLLRDLTAAEPVPFRQREADRLTRRRAHDEVADQARVNAILKLLQCPRFDVRGNELLEE